MALRYAASRSVSASALSCSSSRSMAVRAFASSSSSIVGADQTLAQNKIYHKTNMAALILTPVALAAHPSALSMPIDVSLAILFPLHAHFGMNWIMTDYVSKDASHPARFAMAAATALTALGLLKLSVTGDGIVGSMKNLWTGAPSKETAEKK